MGRLMVMGMGRVMWCNVTMPLNSGAIWYRVCREGVLGGDIVQFCGCDSSGVS